MKTIAVRLNKTIEYELHLMVDDDRDDEYCLKLALACEPLDLEEVDKQTPDEQCKMIAAYNDMLDWREVTQ
jgi:hypothetical protein